METNAPKDYITLQAGPANNYAIVYEKRMPFDNKDKCTGEVGNIVYSKAGLTRFNKVCNFCYIKENSR